VTQGLQVAADIGGTFTDLVFRWADGRLDKRKVPTTPAHFGQAIVDAVAAYLREHDIGSTAVGEILHATTVATNAILERRGAKVALVTTEGFRDVLELRRIRIPFSYDLSWKKPEPMAAREFRFEVRERIGADGSVLTPLDESALEAALQTIVEGQIESVAVCCLHAYRNPAHEKAIGAILAQRLPGVPISLSHEILPEIREFERTSTTVVNAYVMPLVRRYLQDLQARFGQLDIHSPILVMQSAGGLISAPTACDRPVTIIESGPAAGVVASSRIASASGYANVITFDMGGTTSKASMIENGEMLRASEYEVGSEISVSSRLVRGSGYLLRMPVIDISEVGVGGGSIARIDTAGALRVGPRSAGSVPGPACYGKGNDLPTVTDANLALGYLASASLAGGELTVDPALAHRALQMHLCATTGMDVDRAAWGIHLVANSTMVRAVKTVSVERGRDPREFVMMAFGGSGPLHAAGVARELGIRRVLIPPSPGVFSAFGLLNAPIEQHAARSILCSTQARDLPLIVEAYAALQRDMRERMSAEKLDVEKITMTASADLRYRGQSAEITVPVDTLVLDEAGLRRLEQAFEKEYARTFGHQGSGKDFEFVTARLVGGTSRPRGLDDRWTQDRASGDPSPTERLAYFGPEQGWLKTRVLRRRDLSTGRADGPALIVEYDTTVVVPPGCHANVDAHDNIVIDIGR
jgi:N-methylhydantoinase A